MSELEVLRRQAVRAWTWFEETVVDITEEQANWWPPGTANSIGTSYLHVVINTDVEVRRLMHGREPLVEGQHWSGDVGQGVPYDADDFDRWTRHVAVDWSRLQAYGREVHKDFIASLDELTDAHITMPIDMTRSGLGMWEGRDLLELHGSNHVHIHGGEIACVKGLQGGVGWAEPDEFSRVVDVDDTGR